MLDTVRSMLDDLNVENTTGATVTNPNQQVQMERAFKSRPGDAREDEWIKVGLADLLGLSWIDHGPTELVVASEARSRGSMFRTFALNLPTSRWCLREPWRKR